MPIDPSPLFDIDDDPGTFNAARAFSLGLLAAIAYQDNQIHVDRWGDAFGFDSSKTVVTPGPFMPNFAICKGGGRAVIAVSGTEHQEQMFSNIIHSAQAPSLGGIAGVIHSYFRWTAESLAPFVAAELADQPVGTQLVFTGHSLGGATAYLLADIFAESGNWDVRRVMGFNSPKVGDAAFEAAARSFHRENIVHDRDKVNHVPPPLSLQIETPTGIDWNVFVFWEPWPYVHVIEIGEDSGGATASLGTAASLIFGMVQYGMKHGRILGSANSAYAAQWANARYPMPSARAVTVVRGAGVALCVLGVFALNINNHSIETLLRGIKALHLDHRQEFDVTELLAAMEAALAGLPPAIPAASTPVDVPPVGTFLTADPIPPLPAPLPVIQPGTASNVASWEYRAYPMRGELAEVADIFILPEPAPTLDVVLAGFSERRHWHFRGADRRLLETFWECLEAIEARDTIAATGQRSAALSTRETMFSDADDELREAFYAVKDQVNFQLGLFRE